MNIKDAEGFLSQLPLPAAHFNPSGEVVFLNSAFTKLLGYTKADIPTVEAHWPVFFPDDAYRKKVQKDWVTMLEESAKLGLPIQPMLLDIVAKNGEVKKLEVHSLQMGDMAITMWIDFTAKLKAEEELRIAAIAFDSEAVMLITNSAGVIIRVNKAFTRLTGYTSEDALGQTPAMLKSGRHDKEFYQHMWSILLEKGYWQGVMWNKRKNGSFYVDLLTITAVVSPDGRVSHYVGTYSDITHSKETEAKIYRLSYYDPITQLPNRRLLQERLEQVLTSTKRSGTYGALLFIDLDKFKMLNDTRGHDVGDMLLQQVAERLVSCLSEADTVARLGGDEFVVMLKCLSENLIEAVAQAEVAGEKILATFNQSYLLAGYEHHITASIGVTMFSGNLSSSEELLKQADIAMYQSKTDGRNTLRFFDPEMQAIVSKRASLEADLREALAQKQFVVYYQPQVAGDGRYTGAEALVRWLHPQRGLVSPLEFIPLCEETGLVLPLGHWVLETSCIQLAKWAEKPDTAHLSIAVNVSANQFHQENFVDQVLEALSNAGANPYKLKLELTESMLVSDVENIIAKMSILKDHGVTFSLDDFGTGYSSLSYLKRLPLDQLKIDQSFVRNILTDPNDAAIAKTIISLSDSLGLKVIAEGVEIDAQKDFLARHGCHAFQGYLFSKPVPIEKFEQLLGEFHSKVHHSLDK